MFNFIKPKPVDYLGSLIAGEDPVAWAFRALTQPKRKADLQHLVDLLGYQEAAEIIQEVLADEGRQKAIRRDYRENDLEYHFLPETLRALLAFRFFCGGLAEAAHSLVDSIATTAPLEDRPLIEIYFMMENHRTSGAMLARVAKDPDLLLQMEETLKTMRQAVQQAPRPAKSEAEQYGEIAKRIGYFAPSPNFQSGVELMEIIARSPLAIPSLRDAALVIYVLDPSRALKNNLAVLKALNENPDPSIVYGHIPHVPANTYLKLIEQFTVYSDESENNTLLKGIRDFASRYLDQYPESYPALKTPASLDKIAATAERVVGMYFSPLQFNMMIELTRALTPDLKPMAQPQEKPLPRLMALSPLMTLDYTNRSDGTNLREALKAYAATIVAYYQLQPRKLAARVNDPDSAMLVGALIDDDLVKNAGKDTLLTWKLEADLGL
ncbi:hypothetical protein [Pseudomonas sp. Leaf58]|uniref:hypothetical protein n=2 Tax=Pseudomonas sp. Leaf58 TaxID=1736226 RepID=UPI0006F84F0D|nr:hypothetical protein [Pseudomonas sp. Leaf58]KQN62454.1 hypothetical protein ASF02_09910 [Pseudomonas sp. Leaf58]